MGRNRDEKRREQARLQRVARVRRRGRSTRVLAVLLGAVALLLAFGAHQTWTQERAFGKASPCNFDGPVPDPSSCLPAADGTVISLHQGLSLDEPEAEAG